MFHRSLVEFGSLEVDGSTGQLCVVVADGFGYRDDVDWFDWGKNLDKSDLVKGINTAGFFLAIVNAEGPFCGPIAAAFRSVDLHDVVSSVKGDLEVELGRSSSLPDIRMVLFNYLAVHIDDSSTAKVRRDLELVGRGLGDGEGQLIVETDIP